MSMVACAAVTVVLLAVGVTPAAGDVAGAARSTPRPTRSVVPPLSHVFTIVLENYRVEDVTPAAAPYLASLTSRGVTLDDMFGVDHFSLTNYIAMTSGNASNALTRGDCLQYDCIYTPPDDTNIGDQLEAAGKSWKAYMESMPAPCTHPTVSGALDPYLVGYATRHNPFMYYQDVVGTDLTVKSPRCVAHDVPYPQLTADLAAHALPNYSLIVPNTCNDAHDRGTSCSLPTADTWLASHLPAILGSSEYRNGGAVVITFDESDLSDVRGCCGNAKGGHIFTLVLSPFIATPGAHSSVAYSHYSLLRTVEDAFRLPCLRHACDAPTQPLGEDVWGRGRSVTTRYTAQELSALDALVMRVGGPVDQVQRRCVDALAWITAAGGARPGRPRPAPVSAGPVGVTTGWGRSDLAPLDLLQVHYRLNAPRAQKLAVDVCPLLL